MVILTILVLLTHHDYCNQEGVKLTQIDTGYFEPCWLFQLIFFYCAPPTTDHFTPRCACARGVTTILLEDCQFELIVSKYVWLNNKDLCAFLSPPSPPPPPPPPKKKQQQKLSTVLYCEVWYTVHTTLLNIATNCTNLYSYGTVHP